MSLASYPRFCMAAICLGMVGCGTLSTWGLARVVDLPLASVHSDISFTVTSSSRLNFSCAEGSACPSEAGSSPAIRFALQVQRIAALLQIGAQVLYPNLATRAPALADRRFDVYVVEGGEQNSASSANGRISLSAALGTGQPYDVWIAFIIAREMGHVIARHHEENSGASIATSIILNILVPGSGLLKSAISTAGASLAARSKRDVQEREADAIAFRLLGAAHFPLRDVAQSLLLVPVSSDKGSWSANFQKSSDHLLAEVHSAELIAGKRARQTAVLAGRGQSAVHASSLSSP